MSSIKDRLLLKAKAQKKTQLLEHNSPNGFKKELPHLKKYERLCDFEHYAEYKNILHFRSLGKVLRIENPFFAIHEGIPSATTSIQGKTCINFSSYNYLNLNGDPRVSAAAKNAIDSYGTSVSASRLVSGERLVQQELEQRLAKIHGVESCLTFVSGHATNVSTIGCLFNEKDLILHDELIHDSVRQGIKLSGAFRLAFPHNNWNALSEILALRRHEFERVLIVIEGIYSMDGDFPELPRFIEIKKQYKAFLMIDEAHSLGTFGKTGGGIGEYFNIDRHDVDIWMGTLSKSLASCGGYIAGTEALIDILRFSAPGFLYSVGLSPPLAAAALTATDILLQEPERVAALNTNTQVFLNKAKEAGLKTGLSRGINIIPILCGTSQKTVKAARDLHKKGISAQAIMYPAVAEHEARLRFFINSQHSLEQITYTVNELAKLDL